MHSWHGQAKTVKLWARLSWESCVAIKQRCSGKFRWLFSVCFSFLYCPIDFILLFASLYYRNIDYKGFTGFWVWWKSHCRTKDECNTIKCCDELQTVCRITSLLISCVCLLASYPVLWTQNKGRVPFWYIRFKKCLIFDYLLWNDIMEYTETTNKTAMCSYTVAQRFKYCLSFAPDCRSWKLETKTAKNSYKESHVQTPKTLCLHPMLSHPNSFLEASLSAYQVAKVPTLICRLVACATVTV